MNKPRLMLGCFIALLFASQIDNVSRAKNPQQHVLFNDVTFAEADAVLVSKVTSHGLDQVYAWQSEKTLVPASLNKLLMTYLALDKWGADHRFKTDFFIEQTKDSKILWVKGYGDPFLTSEELNRVVKNLQPLPQGVDTIAIDNSWFDINKVPGRTQVRDPYNAPLSAVSANFNTVFLEKENGRIRSAESQTPLTPTALKIGKGLTKNRERLNLIDADIAQRYFAELLLRKLAMPELDILINKEVSSSAKRLYTHINSNTLADNLRATLKYSNNFIANQIFLNLAQSSDATNIATQSQKLTFSKAQQSADRVLTKMFSWSNFVMLDGAGLSHANRLSATQLQQVLLALSEHKDLLNRIDLKKNGVEVYAKTGTLDGVRSYAGYIQVSNAGVADNYIFVFMFNRTVPFRYRDSMLEKLVNELSQ